MEGFGGTREIKFLFFSTNMPPKGLTEGSSRAAGPRTLTLLQKPLRNSSFTKFTHLPAAGLNSPKQAVLVCT